MRSTSFNHVCAAGLCLTLCIAFAAGSSSADDGIPLPFEGLYESRGSSARERVAEDRWREIPQDVQIQILKDKEIIELQLRIQVYASEREDSSNGYTIQNQMWLVEKPQQSSNFESGRIAFDVYKSNPRSGRFEDRGDGYCEASNCQYSYITKKPGYEQRYDSYINWQPPLAGIEFDQRGSLSRKADGESEWLTFKSWKNTFHRAHRDHITDR